MEIIDNNIENIYHKAIVLYSFFPLKYIFNILSVLKQAFGSLTKSL